MVDCVFNPAVNMVPMVKDRLAEADPESKFRLFESDQPGVSGVAARLAYWPETQNGTPPWSAQTDLPPPKPNTEAASLITPCGRSRGHMPKPVVAGTDGSVTLILARAPDAGNS